MGCFSYCSSDSYRCLVAAILAAFAVAFVALVAFVIAALVAASAAENATAVGATWMLRRVLLLLLQCSFFLH